MLSFHIPVSQTKKKKKSNRFLLRNFLSPSPSKEVSIHVWVTVTHRYMSDPKDHLIKFSSPSDLSTIRNLAALEPSILSGLSNFLANFPYRLVFSKMKFRV